MASYRVVSAEIRQWVRELVRANGVRPTGRRLQLADATVARVVAGLEVSAGTEAILEAAYRRQREAA